jgi:hypothetical protein
MFPPEVVRLTFSRFVNEVFAGLGVAPKWGCRTMGGEDLNLPSGGSQISRHPQGLLEE